MWGGDRISFPLRVFLKKFSNFSKEAQGTALSRARSMGILSGLKFPTGDKFDRMRQLSTAGISSLGIGCLRGKFLISNPLEFQPNLSEVFSWGQG